MTRKLLALIMLLFFAVSMTAAAELERMKYNNPGLIVDLAVGLWAWPVPVDVNGDGHTDLIISCEDNPYNGTYYFENTGNDKKHPVFKAARRLGKGVINVQASYVDGKLRVLTPAAEYPDFTKTGVEQPVPLEGLKANVHPHKVRGNMWKYVDYNGDGLLDLVIGTDDWTDYGWDDAYDAQGHWKNGPLRGNIYVMLNQGTNAKPKYADAVMLKDIDGDNLETYGWPNPCFADWDNDGDLDIIVSEFVDGLFFMENIGTRTEPKYKKRVALTYENGERVHVDLAMITPTAFDWDGDGDLDILAGDEDGRIALFENSGKLKNGMPVFLEPWYFKQEADDLKTGALSTPSGYDWDGDGDWDLICGNSAGYIVWFENLSGPGVERPKWSAPKFCEVQGKPIRVQAGINGSIQGPCERKWGYTTLTVNDWDGDGLGDVLFSSILGKVMWCKNIGTRSQPKLAAPKPIEVEWKNGQPKLDWGWMKPEGKALLTQWRTTPVAFDWNRDGLTDLIMLDHEGYLAFFERFKAKDGSLQLMEPKRIFYRTNGDLVRLNPRRAGGSGRRKLCLVDYDLDGKVDLIANSKNADFFRQTESKDGKITFSSPKMMSDARLAGHTSSPTVVDFNNDKVPDLVIGAEDGHFYYMKNGHMKNDR